MNRRYIMNRANSATPTAMLGGGSKTHFSFPNGGGGHDSSNSRSSSPSSPLAAALSDSGEPSRPSSSLGYLAPSEPAEHRPARLGDHVPELGDCVGFITAGSERFSLGELGLLENIPRTATLRAEGAAILLRIDRETFLDLVKV